MGWGGRTAHNALSMEMINEVRSRWTGGRRSAGRPDPDRRCGRARAVARGADIRLLYDGIRGEAIAPPTSRADEHPMDAELAKFAKPIVAYMVGITLGGGVASPVTAASTAGDHAVPAGLDRRVLHRRRRRHDRAATAGASRTVGPGDRRAPVDDGADVAQGHPGQ